MAETYFPYDAGAGSAIDEDQWREMMSRLIRDGVWRGQLDELAVSANGSGMQVFVAAGQAWNEGNFYLNDDVLTLAIGDNGTSNPRIDRVVLRNDFVGNTMQTVVRAGTAAVSPVAPALQQDDTAWEISLAQVRVEAGAVSIAADKVTDERSFAMPVYPWATSAGSSAVGNTQSPGTADMFARGDHRHAREGFGAPVASAVADAGSSGAASTVARSDHKHGREGFGSPAASAVGDTQSAGAATTVARSDHRHAREAFGGTPSANTAGQAGAAGAATTPSRSDHKHATSTHTKADHDALNIDADTLDGLDSTAFVQGSLGSTTPGTESFGTAGGPGSGSAVARLSHVHPMPTHTKADHDALNIDADTLDGHDSFEFNRLVGVSNTYTGSVPPAGTAFLEQFGSQALHTTLGGQIGPIVFPTAFLSGLATILFSCGDDVNPVSFSLQASLSSRTEFYAIVRHLSDGSIASNEDVRCNWLAKGW